VRLSVRENGWYRVTQPDLAAAGVPTTVDPRKLQLFVDGTELPIVVNGADDGRFDPADSIEFYGTALDTPWTDVHSYYLLVGDTAGARISTAPSTSSTPVTTFTQTVERRDRVFFLSNLDDDDSFFGPIVSSDPIDQMLRLRNLAAAGDATLTVSLVGTSDVDDPIQHVVTVDLNGHRAGTLSFSRIERPTATFLVPHDWLVDGDNVVTLHGIAGEHDYSLVDAIRIAYPHAAQADDGTLLAQLPAGAALSVTGLGSGARAIDITNPQAVFLVGAAEADGVLTATTASSLGPRTLFAFDEAHVLHPAAITARQATHLHSAAQRADLLIVTHADFRAAVEPLRALRASQGLEVAVVDAQDVFDEFTFGAASPYALRELFTLANASWAKHLRYVLLVGDSTFDSRNYLGKGAADFVPSKMLMGSEIKAVSDGWLTDFDGDGVENIPIGRLPVRTAEQAATTIGKIVAYDAQPLGAWASRVILVSGDDPSLGFSTATASIAPMLPGNTTVEQIDIAASGANAAREQLLSAFDQGALVIDYVGHGSVEVWNNSGFFNDADAAQLTNGDRLPLVVAMTCLNGEFDDVYTISLAESLLNAPNGGAVAVWASSSLTEVDGQKSANLLLMQNLFPAGGGSPRIGDAIQATKLGVPDGPLRTTWNLFGDPSMRLQR
jgi:hypothetical protein